MHNADSSPFSLLSVLSADGKIFPKLFPYFKTYPTGTDRPHIHQSQTTSSNKLYKYPEQTTHLGTDLLENEEEEDPNSS